MRIDDFYLNPTEKAAVLSYCENRSFPHTLLIEGGSMDERTQFARFLANMIVCTGEGERPCGKCNACIKCAASSHPDVKEYGEEKEKYTFKVEVSREIRSDAFVIPNDSDTKVYIIKEAQNMNDSAENALLKIFEEPPYFDHFIMTCSSRSAMLDTVLSRSTVISMGFTEESFDADTFVLCDKIIDALCSDDELKLLTVLSELSNDRDLFLPVIHCLTRTFLEALKQKNGLTAAEDYENSANRLCDRFAQSRIYSLVNTCRELETRHAQNANYNLLITYMSISLKRS